MGSFKDNQERTWSIDLTVGKLKRIRSTLDINLLDGNPNTFDNLAEDVFVMHDLVWLLCEEQAAKREISEEEFGAAVVGDPIADAIGVVLGAIPDFFRGRKKSLLRKALAKMHEARTQAEKLAEETLDDPALQAKMLEAMRQGIQRQIDRALTQSS